MSDSQQSDREYLISRGWVEAQDPLQPGADMRWWISPHHPPQSLRGGVQQVDMEVALIDQRARDATEERRAFDRYFAGQSAMLSTDNENEVFTPLFSLDEARERARRMVELRRQEFSRPDPATTFCSHMRALAEKARSAGTILLPSDVLDALNASGAGKDS